MGDFLYLLWHTLKLTWYQISYLVKDHIGLEVAAGTSLILIWIFMAPSFRK